MYSSAVSSTSAFDDKNPLSQRYAIFSGTIITDRSFQYCLIDMFLNGLFRELAALYACQVINKMPRPSQPSSNVYTYPLSKQ